MILRFPIAGIIAPHFTIRSLFHCHIIILQVVLQMHLYSTIAIIISHDRLEIVHTTVIGVVDDTTSGFHVSTMDFRGYPRPHDVCRCEEPAGLFKLFYLHGPLFELVFLQLISVATGCCHHHAILLRSYYAARTYYEFSSGFQDLTLDVVFATRFASRYYCFCWLLAGQCCSATTPVILLDIISDLITLLLDRFPHSSSCCTHIGASSSIVPFIKSLRASGFVWPW